MEKNQNYKTVDLLEQAMTLTELASKCLRLGLIDDFDVEITVKTEVDYTFRVRTDSYTSRERKWEAVASSFHPEGDHVDDGALMEHLNELINTRKASLLAELEIVEE